jgi:hypothetical protein
MKLSKFTRGAVVAFMFGAVLPLVGIGVISTVAGASTTTTTTPATSSTACPAGWTDNGTTGCYKVTTLTEVACQSDHGAWTEGLATNNCAIGIDYGVSPCPAGWTDNGSTGCYTHLTFPNATACAYNGGTWSGGKTNNCLRGLSYTTPVPVANKVVTCHKSGNVRVVVGTPAKATCPKGWKS